jgi:ADP-ribosyl-[dinitrogen reductase] hydrolase
MGAMIGAAVGDALGTTLEFSSPAAAVEKGFPSKMDGPLVDVVGGGPFNVAVGQVTDDTQMAVALARSLVACKGYVAADVAPRYLHWRTNAFDCGGQTGGSLATVKGRPDVPPYEAGFHYWSLNRRGAGNGSLMRTSPIGAYFGLSGDHDALIEASVLDSMITHADPLCLLACAAYNNAIAYAMTYADKEPISTGLMGDAAILGLDRAMDFIRDRFPGFYTDAELFNAQSALCEDLFLAYCADPKLFASTSRLGVGGARIVGIHSTPGFVRTAFRYAFWALHHSTNYREAIIDVVNRGGDSDTNGAIAGGLLGAYYGLDGIPPEWVDKVMTACQDPRLNKRFWWENYHPRLLGQVVAVQSGS